MLMLECLIECLFMWGICYLSTGTDEKNLKGYRSYPTNVQQAVKQQPIWTDKRKKDSNAAAVFLSNFILFTGIYLLLGSFIKRRTYLENFLQILLLGEVLNLFDLIVIDLIWWRNTKRIRFSFLPEKKYYVDPSRHIQSFWRGCVMYLLIAGVDGFILTVLF